MSELLYLGDVIVLDSDSIGAVASQGLADEEATIHPHLINGHIDYHQAAFLVRAQQNYAAENALCAELDAQGLSRDKAHVKPEFRRLFDARANEIRINAGEFEQKKGLEVRYGSVVQLQHSISEKYLHVSRQRTSSRDGCRVTVDRNAGELAWFKIMPSLRVHTEGEPVHLGDRVILENVMSGLCLCISMGTIAVGFNRVPRRDVFGGSPKDAAPLSLRLFRSWRDSQQRKRHLLGGSPMRLFHKEGEGALIATVDRRLTPAAAGPAGTATSAAEAGAASALDALADTHVMVARDPAGKASSYTIWEFARAEPESGAPLASGGGNALPWDGAFRIVHACTGRALAIVSNPGASASYQHGEAAPVASSTPAAARKAEGAAPVMGAPVLVDEGAALLNPTGTLFQLVAQYEKDEQAVRLDRHFLIRHVATGCFLHMTDDEHDDEEATSDAPMRLRKARKLVATPKRYDVDVFGCQPVEPEVLRDLLYVEAQVVQLSSYIETFRQAAHRGEAHRGEAHRGEAHRGEAQDMRRIEIDFEGVQALLTHLIFFVTCETDNLDPMLREGLPRPAQQVKKPTLADLTL